MYEAIRLTSNSVEHSTMRQFFDKFFLAAEVWHFLCKEFTSEPNMGQSELIHQISRLKMEPGKANDYIAEKMKLRDRLFAVNYPITRISFNEYLVQSVPEEWETLKKTMRGLSTTMTEAEMIATIRDEDNVYRRSTESERAYIANAPPKRRSNKGNS